MGNLIRTYYIRHERLDDINWRRKKKVPPSLEREMRVLAHQKRVTEQESKNRMMEMLL